MQIGVESSRAVESKRVFVVGGDEITRAALQFMLHDEYETHEFADLARAYDKAVDWRPDAVLLTVDLVELHGAAVIIELRARIAGVRIAVVCESADDPAARRCLEEGAHSMLAKPLTIESVRRKVDRLLGRRSALTIPIAVL